MFLATHGILARGGGVAPSLLLDTYPNAAVAYSLRKLRTAYSGSAIRVRRSSDNTEQDIVFSGNDLDTQTMLDFVGYNLWTYSEDLSNAAYGKTGLNTTGTPAYIDVETAPDGTLTGDKMIESAVTSAHRISRSGGFTSVIGVDYNISFYVKQGERTKMQYSTSFSGGTQTCDIDLTNGTISNNGFANTPIVTAEANGWYRFSVTITAGTTSTIGILTISLMNGTATSYAGDGTSGAYVWGFQLSQTSSVKTYQKTVATAGGNGFVTTWYDQSTNANNSTQATATIQAQVVLNGNLILDVDTNKITTTWTTDRYTLTTGISANTKYLSISMFRRISAGDRLVHLGSATSNSPNTLIWFNSTSSYLIRNFMPTSFDFDNISTLGRCIMTSLKDATDLKVAYRNGVQLTNTATEAPAAGTLNVFGQIAATSQTSGQYQEYIYWNSEQSANRTGIETNINTYWNAY